MAQPFNPEFGYADQQYAKLTREQGGPGSIMGGTQNAHDTTAFGTQERRFESGAVRFDAGSPRFDLVCPQMALANARTATEGLKKYAEWNWTKGMPIRDTISHAINHLQQLLAGDGSEPHLDHAAFNIMMALHFAAGCECHHAVKSHMAVDKAYLSRQR